MGRIKKAATERHMATLSPFVKSFVQRATEIPLHQLPAHLDSFPQHWPLPRGDLYHWIPLLDRFDHVLELFNKEYALKDGPQTQPFERRLLEKGDGEEGQPYPSHGTGSQELEGLGYSGEGDRELVETLLHFTRILLEHCGNRSLYASSTHISDLLHTTSLSLLRLCLKLSLRLAQRYQVARYKNHHPSAQPVLLANHYNLNLDNLHKIAMPFQKPQHFSAPFIQAPGKGKDKSSSTTSFNPLDLVSIAKEPLSATLRTELSNVALSYYEQAGPASGPAVPDQLPDGSPSTPTPTRRTSNLGPSRDRPSTGDSSVSANDSSSVSKGREAESTSTTAPIQFQISAAKVVGTPSWSLVNESLPSVPADMQYDLLNRIRIAKAFAEQDVTNQQLLEIRLLAVANLAYALPDSKFQEKIGIPDAENPRRFHLASQLCDLLQPATNGQTPLTLQSETTVIMTLESLTKSRHKVAEVADALTITVNHGVLYYELRKVIATLNVEEHTDSKKELQEAEWRDSAFDLINSLLQSNTQARYGERMVSAGIMAILVEALKLRTSRAERFYERVLQFFDSFVHGIPAAFQALAEAKGLDIIADLVAFEVNTAIQNAHDESGLPEDCKSKVVDYDIPFYQQSTLRQLFKNTVHMFEHNGGTHDRLLRNLIDTPQILGALQKVIENARIFGSNVWSGAVNIVSSFIHNEPTSYQVIGEAGLSKALLEAIVGKKLPETLPSLLDDAVPIQDTESLDITDSGEPNFPSVDGILPVGEVMCDVPTAFGAICLNETGMQLFQASGALVKYFDIFLSPVHVRAMEEENQTAATIGHSFDELSRHHPRLKDQIMAAVFNMLKRLRELCTLFAVNQRSGAKLWQRLDGKLSIAGGKAALRGTSTSYTEGAISGSSDSQPAEETIKSEDLVNEDEHERAPAIPYLTACFKFLEGFFHNSTMCSLFCDMSGAEILLDLAASPSVPYDLVAFPLFSKITQALKSMCESKPQLVLPSIIRRTQRAVVGVEALTASKSNASSFAQFVELSDSRDSPSSDKLEGTSLLKSLVNAHLLTHVLGRALAPPAYTLRHGSQNNHVFTNLNFTEIYLQLIDDLAMLHASCVWEGILLMHDISDQKRANSEPRPFVMRRIDMNGTVELASEKNAEAPRNGSNSEDGTETTRSREAILALKNLKAIRYLLSQVPMGIESFFHSLGQAIVTKRMEASAKQHAILVADRLANALVWELEFRRNKVSDESLETRYTAGMLSMISRMLLRNSYSMEAFGTKEALTLVMSKFYIANGFGLVNEYLDRFLQLLAKQQEDDKVDNHVKDAIQSILNFYDQVVRSKCINDASQSNVITVRDKTQPDYFQPGQFLVEVRDAVLPAIDKIWHSENIEKLTDTNMRCVVDILRLVLKAEGEERALRRSEHVNRRVLARPLEFKLRSTDGLDRLTHVLHFDQALSREAIYRCNNNTATAEAYCRLRLRDANVPRFPIPDGETPQPDADSSNQAETENNGGREDVEMTITAEQNPVEMVDAEGYLATERALPDTDDNAPVALDNEMGSDDDDINMGTLGQIPADLRAEDLDAMGNRRVLEMLNAIRPSLQGKETQEPYVTVDDLDDRRRDLRDDLIDRCLEVLSTQSGITFELADLIQAAVAKAGEGANPRADIGTTLVSSLMSLQAEEPSKEAGLKIHAYAHLVALILQDRDFFDSILDELKEYFENLVMWVQLEPDQKAEDAPWIDMVLLIIERVLAEDEQPREIEWDPPSADDPLKPVPLPPMPESVVAAELRSQLFDALIDLLPKIGKNSTLALSVSRVLVVLTRRRDLAARLSDRHTMGRLFLMIRQLTGSVDEKIQSSFMLILRHMIEDDEAIRQNMRAEIKFAFDNHRSSRPMETTTYTRNMYHLALRSPQLFIDVTQEMLEITRFDGNPHRAQSLALKKERTPTTAVQSGNSVSAPEGSTPDTSKASETKPALAVEGTDGVVQFLLRELSNYKDVEDKPLQLAPEVPVDRPLADAASLDADVEMADSSANATAAVDTGSRTSKPVFRPEQHAIYVYRCFILQCLAELLACYNRTKVEFINFSRKPDTQPATPTKPRAGTLNYLLNTLLPVGTLEHRDDVDHRKKVATSTWATGVLAALCSKTQERQIYNLHPFDTPEFAEQEPELTFVRKFVLEHALRAFKEATNSSEPLDQRYSRLLALGELFNRMLNDKVDIQRSNLAVAGNFNSHQQLGRLMYEKNFIGTLTSAIAELDLNFPNAKRAVKYILGPLKQLTELGVTLSQTSDLSSSTGAVTSADEEDEISSATSEEDEDRREQTPDLFRGSSLGILEGGTRNDDESDSEDDGDDGDDEMYDEAYDEEMDYEEDGVAEHGDVVSDDDDDLDGMGEIEGIPGDVEIEVDMTMEDEDDDDTEEDDDDDMSDEDDDDPDDDVNFATHMDEITGDDENASIVEHDHEGDWEDDGMDYDAMVPPHGGGSPHGGPLEQLAHVLGAEDPSDSGDHDGVVRIDMGPGEDEFFEDEMPPEDDDDEDEEGEFGEDIVYEPEMEDDEDDDHGAAWAWDARPPAAILHGHHHHHHHHHRGFNELVGMIGGDPLRPAGHFRTHRSTPNARDEDGINPLLQREGSTNAANRNRENMDIARLAGRRPFLPRHGDSVLQDLVAAVGAPGGNGIINVNIEPGAMPGLGALPSMFTVQNGPGGAMIDFDPRRSWREQINLNRWPDMTTGGRLADRTAGGNSNSNSEAQAVDFRPNSTTHRWQEEARMLFPGKFHEKATRVINMIFRVLVPAAMEAKRLREKEEAERRAAEQKAADEKLEAEKAEREAQEKKESEEREAREREEAEARAREEADRAAEAGTENPETSGMEGVEQQGQAAEAGRDETVAPSAEQGPTERITITHRGRELDITSLGIDREYIEALPEEMREEVIMAQLAEQRQQQVDSGERPSEISREFLEALPREIQQELLRSEQMERRRRERDEARRRATQEGAAAQPEEMNNADFMAMLDPALRQAVLMDADDSVLASLPEDLQAEARALFGDRRVPRGDHTARGGRGLDVAGARILNGNNGRADDDGRETSRPRRPVAQMLDKAGVATLLRLMFVSLNHKSKTNLHSILSDVCKNTQNRAEVISILLSILQDGTADVNAVERSFAQLSLRAKQPSAPKTPQPLKRTLTGQTGVTASTELSPLNIVQQCLGTLNALANDNSRVQSFFLNEHETITSQKAKSAKRGKGKENRAVKFPLNALLALLDRKLITENTAVMETLASLLSHVTRPLTLLIRRAKEAQEAEKAAATGTASHESEGLTDTRPERSLSDVPMEEAAAAQSSEVAEASEAPAGIARETKDEPSNETSTKEDVKKKHRDLSPPDVPDENIRLVVNILAARECPSKTFSDTLDIIKNLSAIPGAKEVFGKELTRQAQELGDALLLDLDELAKQINAAQSGTELQGMALASFSSAGSKQRKLLRVLVALDHLFDPKRTPTVESTTTASSSTDQKLKDDVLATLYESTTFEKLWHGLSLCLTAIRQRGNMLNVATILLPLIESLMVVCRNSALKESPPSLTSTLGTKGGTPTPDARLDTLFFNFTEEHRKILNELIRNNPKLMNGNLSVLAKNSKVLEFDNKRNFFSRKLHDRRSEVRVAHPSLQLSVRRDQVFLDSFKSLYYKSGNEIKYGKLNIRFHGEEGIDAGGVSREWFGAMARQMFNPGYALFNPVASDRTTFHPNSLSEVNPEHLLFFKFIGRIIGKALYENRVLDCHFSRAVYRKILGKTVSLKDMETLDLDYYKSLVWILENDITDVTFETFSVDVDSFGETQTIDLIPGGRDIAVTEENKQDYVQLVVEYRLIKSVQAQLDNFLEGFHEIIPSELVSIFNEQELELLISGLPDIDVEDWKNNSEYHNYQPTSPQIQWFWRAVRSFDKEEKAKLLQFVTGTSKVPLNGFKELEGMNGFAKFNIHRDYSSKEKLPSSHTCFNQLDLPEYDSYEQLRQQMYTAITAGSEYFGFA